MRCVPTMVISRIFAGLEPAALDSGEAFVPEGQRDIGHVLDTRGDMGVTLAVDDLRKFSQEYAE